jgi:excisionase family DNA binding protein
MAHIPANQQEENEGTMSEATARNESPLPTEGSRRVAISEQDQQDVKAIYEAIRAGRAKLVSPSGEARPLPGSLYAFLVELIGLLASGESVYIVQNQAKLTTVEAAAMIGVSRQFLVNLLEKREIPYHMVGTHRRIYAQDLLAYKAKRDENRRQILGELAKREAEEGLYERTPSADED